MMAAKLKALWGMRNGIILFFTPFVFLPLPLVIGTTEAAGAYVIALMAVYWCTEVLPLAVTALLPAVLFPLFGIMESKDVCMQYLKDTNMLFLGGLMVAVAVEHWNLHKRIALRVLLLVGVRPALLMLGFMGVTAFLSMWISNTATTAMMVPIVQAVLEQLNHRRAEGGEEKSISLPEAGERPVEKQANGQAPLVVMNGMSVEVEHEREEEERLKMCKGLTLCVCYAASIGGTATLTGTGPNLVLSGQMNQLFPKNGDVINFASWFGFAFPNMILMLTIAWLWLQFVFMGFNFRKTWGCGAEKTEKETAAYNVIREEHQRLGPMSFGEVSVLGLFVLLVVLWFTREPGFVDGWATNLFNSQKEFVTDATVAVFVATLLFVLPSRPPRLFCGESHRFDISPQRSPEVEATPPLLTWKVAQKKMPWSIVLLLGGGFALAKGSEESGLSSWLGEQMTPLQTIPPWAIAIILCLLIATFTECTSNVATATLFLPILASMCQSIRVNPLYVMIPCTLSASFAFMLPVATPPNAIVFSYGYLKVSDMARTGVVMNIIGILCITLAINSWGRAMFNLDTFPSWANATNI